MKRTQLSQNQTHENKGQASSYWSKIYSKLTEPHPQITVPKARREARLLANMLIFVIITTVVSIPPILNIYPIFDRYIFVILLLEITGYFFSRTRYYRVGLIAMIVIMTGSISYSVKLQEGFSQFHLMAALAWLVLPVILASIFFNLRLVLILITYIIVNLLLLPVLNPNITYMAIAQVFFFVMTAAGLILLLTRHIGQIDEDRLQLLMKQQEKLKLSNRKLQSEIEERLLVEIALEQAQQQLETKVEERTAELAEANKDLETLLYVISHDLKEPLRSIRFFSEMLSQQYADNLDEKGQDWLLRINRNGTKLQSLINDILTLSRILRVDLTCEWVEGQVLVNEAIERLEQRIEETQADIQIEPNLSMMFVNRTWAIQAIFNLISNALKFTIENQSPMIEIASHVESDQIGLVIRDRGIGLSNTDNEQIFQLFQRGVGREIEGSGAGLAIVKQIVERHHGKTWARSRAGGGADFFITFANEARNES